ncbi:MAG: polysaccharide lyase [Burkholderiales bacterium]
MYALTMFIGFTSRCAVASARGIAGMLGILSCTMTTAAAQVDRGVGGAVDGSTLKERYAIVSASESNVALVPDPAGSSRTVFELTVKDTDDRIFKGLRAELSAKKEYVKEGQRWYAMSVYIPETWLDTPAKIVIAQIQTSQKSAVLQPPLAFIVKGRSLYLEVHSNVRDVEGDDSADKQNSSERIVRLGPVAKSQWNCWVINATWSFRPNEGSMKVWMNDEVVFENYNEPNAYKSWLGNNPRVGIYAPSVLGASERRVYADFIWIGGKSTRFEDMYARTPCAVR